MPTFPNLEPAPDSPLHLPTSDFLLALQRPALPAVVANLLPAGLTILAGAPKIGKSWLALQIARAVALGEPLFGEPVTQGPTLYMALEDSQLRLRERLARQAWPTGLRADFMLLPDLAAHFGGLRGQGVSRLDHYLSFRGYRLIVIDTLSRFVSGFHTHLELVTQSLLLLQLVALRLNGAVLIIDHHRKLSRADAVADILGSTVKGAVADTTLGLYRLRGQAGARLAVTGRDVAERTLALHMDWPSGCWQFLGDADQLDLTLRQQEILDALKALERATLTELSRALGQDPSNTFKRLQEMGEAGLIRRQGKYYTL